ncbi:MAG: hypothetical protein HC853_03230 [Anaerolineae bacterium]|nr:hypothetical protein [Anaerolineae bacterium]
MPAPILNMGATVMCAHSGRATLMPNSKVMLSGQTRCAVGNLCCSLLAA